MRESTRQVEFKAGKPAVPVKLSLPGPSRPPAAVAVVLTHGAGGDMDSGYLPRLAAKLAASGLACVRFTCRTLHLPTRVAVFKAVLQAGGSWPEMASVRSWFCAGHSMGGRAACQVAYDIWQQQQQQGQGQQHPKREPSEQEPHPEPLPGQQQQPIFKVANRASSGHGEGDVEAVAAPPAGREGLCAPQQRGAEMKVGAGEAGPAAAVLEAETVVQPAPREFRAQDPQQNKDVGSTGVQSRGSRKRSLLAESASEAPACSSKRQEAPAKAHATRGSGPASTDGAAGHVATAKQRTIAPRAVTASGGTAGAASSGSTGSRDPLIAGCVLLSYPLHPPDKPDQLRDEPLCQLTCPVFFVRGTRDEFSRPALFDAVLERMRMRNPHVQVHAVEGADHSLSLRRGRRRRQDGEDDITEPEGDALEDVVLAVTAFVKGFVSERCT